jgi:transposase
MEIPLPASTLWEIVAETAEWIEPIYQELIHEAAQGEVLHNDDTTMTILALMGESRPRQPSAEEELEEESERTGIFTSGIVSTRAGQKNALFFTGRKHAGENLATMLAQRAEELGPPIQMCDALSRKSPQGVSNRGCELHRARETQVCRGGGEVSRGMPLCVGELGSSVPARGLLPGAGHVGGATSRLPPNP